MKMKKEERTDAMVSTPALTPVSATASARAHRKRRMVNAVRESSLPLRICV